MRPTDICTFCGFPASDRVHRDFERSLPHPFVPEPVAAPPSLPVQERAEFEKWATLRWNLRRSNTGRYTMSEANSAWWGWQARASRSASADGKEK